MSAGIRKNEMGAAFPPNYSRRINFAENKTTFSDKWWKVVWTKAEGSNCKLTQTQWPAGAQPEEPTADTDGFQSYSLARPATDGKGAAHSSAVFVFHILESICSLPANRLCEIHILINELLFNRTYWHCGGWRRQRLRSHGDEWIRHQYVCLCLTLHAVLTSSEEETHATHTKMRQLLKERQRKNTNTFLLLLGLTYK